MPRRKQSTEPEKGGDDKTEEIAQRKTRRSTGSTNEEPNEPAKKVRKEEKTESPVQVTPKKDVPKRKQETPTISLRSAEKSIPVKKRGLRGRSTSIPTEEVKLEIKPEVKSEVKTSPTSKVVPKVKDKEGTASAAGSSPRRKDRTSTGSTGSATPETGSGARTPSGGRKSPAKSEGGASDDSAAADVKRNKSLEALFQVTKSELQNIKQAEPQGQVEVQGQTHLGDGDASCSSSAVLQIPNDEQTLVIVPEESADLNQSTTLTIVVQDENEAEDSPMRFEIEAPEGQELGPIVAQLAGLQQSGQLQQLVKMEGGRGVLSNEFLDMQNVRVVYNKSPKDQSLGAALSPASTIQVTPYDPNGPQIGRKRKHPAIPGKHICPYCGRGCAKPSVLQKHIRAHTGERPYPCIPCGFSFKTKSNLYKHCKSRAHSIKAGLPVKPDSKTESEPGDESDHDPLETLMDDSMDMDSGSGRSSRSSSIAARGSIPKDGSTELPFTVKEENNKSEASGTVLSGSTDQQVLNMLAAGGSIMHPSPTVAAGAVPASSTVLNAEQQALDETSSKPKLPRRQSSDIMIEEPTPEGGTRTIMRLSHGQLLDEPLLGGSLDSGSAALEKESPSRLTVPGMGRRESFTRRRSSASNITPLSLPPRPAPLNLNSPITPEVVRDRINQLINQNAAIMEMPKADAPRPKRMSRQNSENLYPISRSNSDVGLIGSPAALLPEPQYLTPKSVGPSPLALSPSTSGSPDNKALSAHMHRAFSLPEAEIQKQTQKLQKQLQQKEKEKLAQQVSVENNRIQQLVQVAKMASGVTGVKSVQEGITTVKAGAVQASPVVGAYTGAVGTPVTSLPQEIKIQIKLPKPGAQPVATASVTTMQSQQMIGQPNVLYPPTSVIPFGTPPPVPSGVGLLSPPSSSTLPHPLTIVSDKAHSFDATSGSGSGHAIKDLLLRDRRSSLQPSRSHDTPLVVIDPPQEDLQQATHFNTGLMPSPSHQDMRSLSVDASMGMAQMTNLGTSPASPAMHFTTYDPMSPPRRGRPKALRSKSEGLISPLVLSESPTVETSGSKTSVQLSPGGVRMRMPIAPSTSQPPIVSPTRHLSPGNRPQLKLMIPQPSPNSTLQTSVGSATLTPSADPQYLSPGVNSPLFSPGSQPQTPTTPSQFAKLKLKGKLLMKRSMSIEKMEREKALLAGTPASPLVHSASIDASPFSRLSLEGLQRSASIDETKLMRNKAMSLDSGSLETPIVHAGSSARSPLGRSRSVQSSKLSRLQRSVSIHEEPMEVSVSETVMQSNSFDNTGMDGSITSQLPSLPESSLIIDDKALIPKVMVDASCPVPVNRSVGFLRPGVANMAPYFKHSFSQPKESAPLLVNAPIKLVTTASDISRQESKSSDSSVSPPVSLGGITTTTISVSRQSSGGSTGTVGDVQTSGGVVVSPSAGGAGPKPASRLMSDEMGAGNGRLSEKAQVQLLMMGHQYPMLRGTTHGTFCTVAKPQPMYVNQAANKKLSMYSNWRVARFNPNPLGLSSRELMSLHQTHRYHRNPVFLQSAISPGKIGVLTHSSYWNFYNKVKQLQKEGSLEGATDAKIKMDAQLMSPQSSIMHQQSVDTLDVKIVDVHSEANIAAQAITPGSKEIGTPSQTPSNLLTKPNFTLPTERQRIFPGGYKTNEDYIYVRGRGRGRYVCEECGIRCKKPSMLKKHIRTHTNLRPWHCKHCSFSFKTKGNLTKHMKSKVHQRKCFEMGIIPVPMTVDDSQLDPDMLVHHVEIQEDGKNHMRFARPREASVDCMVIEVNTSFDSEGAFDDDVDDDDDQSEPFSESIEQEVEEEHAYIVMEGPDQDDMGHAILKSDGEVVLEAAPQYVAVQDTTTSQPTLVQIGTSQIIKQALDKQTPIALKEITVLKQGGDQVQPSIDKEVAAHLLLDLSKTQQEGETEDQQAARIIAIETARNVVDLQQAQVQQGAAPVAAGSKTTGGAALQQQRRRPSLVRQQAEDISDDKSSGRLGSLIGELISRTKAPGEGTVTTRDTKQLRKSESATDQIVEKASQLNAPKMAATVYQGHVAVQPVSVTVSSMSELSHIHRGGGAGKMSNTYAQKIAALQWANEKDMRRLSEEGSSSSGVSGFVPPNYRQDSEKSAADGTQTKTPGVGDTVSPGAQSGATSTSSSSAIALNFLSQIQGMPSTVNTSGTESQASSTVQYVTGENKAPFEIMPIPGKVNDSSESMVDGKFVCNICGNKFSEEQQFTLHKNIHFFERPFRCEGCNLSFRSKQILQKHQRSEAHQVKVNVNQQFGGAPTKNNPRPFRCEDCDIAFRIHGHLAKHLRSKSHILVLEKDDKIPSGTCTQLEKLDKLGDIDATDSFTTIDSIFSIIDPTGALGHQRASERKTKTPPGGDGAGGDASVSAADVQYGYEKVMRASNERVTVEIKSQPIDIGDISRRGGEPYGDGDTDDSKTNSKQKGRSITGAPHKCGICAKTFESIDVLKQHLVCHAELRPYVCQYCDAGFTTPQSLKFHLRTHTQERPYICGFCGDCFVDSNGLRIHASTHSGVTGELASSIDIARPAKTPTKSPSLARSESLREVKLESGRVIGHVSEDHVTEDVTIATPQQQQQSADSLATVATGDAMTTVNNGNGSSPKNLPVKVLHLNPEQLKELNINLPNLENAEGPVQVYIIEENAVTGVQAGVNVTDGAGAGDSFSGLVAHEQIGQSLVSSTTQPPEGSASAAVVTDRPVEHYSIVSAGVPFQKSEESGFYSMELDDSGMGQAGLSVSGVVDSGVTEATNVNIADPAANQVKDNMSQAASGISRSGSDVIVHGEPERNPKEDGVPPSKRRKLSSASDKKF